MVPWLYAFAVFTVFRLFAFLFASIVNDLIFGYNITMCLLWSLFSIINVYGWVLNYSLYLELRNLSKIEDYAHLRVSCVSLFLNFPASLFDLLSTYELFLSSRWVPWLHSMRQQQTLLLAQDQQLLMELFLHLLFSKGLDLFWYWSVKSSTRSSMILMPPCILTSRKKIYLLSTVFSIILSIFIFKMFK